MKNIMKLKYLMCICIVCFFTSCDDFLDREPLSQITPDVYLNEESQLAAYAIYLYAGVIPTFDEGLDNRLKMDAHTDDVANTAYDNRFIPGEWKTAQTGGSWSFTNIYSINYFLNRVIPLWKEGKISGNAVNISHYIGEIYFLRALEYSKKQQEFGDFPIIREVLPDSKDVLVEASKRYPRNEVARFILSDLDSAIMLLRPVSPDGKNLRISSDCAQILKSRVALFEGTWLKYFKDTQFVPNGAGWPGKEKDYNSSYQFPSGSIDGEIDFFLTQAMASAQVVADHIPLTENNGILQQTESDTPNPYYDMFCSVDLSPYPEVLLWRQFNKELGRMHNVPVAIQEAAFGNGLTRGLIENYLMDNGLPIYAAGSGYEGDDYIADVRKKRDGRLWLFLKEPAQINVIWPSPEGTHATPIEQIPVITHSDIIRRYVTGYSIRKGASFYGNQYGNGQGYTGLLVYRAVEAYLNYMEACYEKNGSLDSKAQGYWTNIRNRARMDTDFNKTINATDMDKEKLNDWGAYSAGKIIDATLYNIRRERRCELVFEGNRYADLRRWRSMDQMITTPYHIEGFKVWGPMKDWYNTGPDESTILIYGLSNDRSNVSAPELGVYLRPYEILSRSLVLGGYKWTMAHYLTPIAIQNFMNTTENNDVSQSPIYQNPGWPLSANQGAN